MRVSRNKAASEQRSMPGTYCRGCGRSKEELGVDDPNQCPEHGPILSAQRTYCEHCGNRLDHVGQEPCLKWGKLAFKFFGK